MEPKITGWESRVAGVFPIVAVASFGLLAWGDVTHDRTWSPWGVTLLTIAVPGLIISVIAAAILQGQRRRRFNHAWYRQQHPTLVDERGRLRCRSCGSNEVQIRNLMNKTYMRAHICGQCGTTLFFSPEV